MHTVRILHPKPGDGLALRGRAARQAQTAQVQRSEYATRDDVLMTKESLGIGLVGCGTVGSGVARLLLEQSDRLAARAGRLLSLRRVVVRDLAKPRPDWLPRELLTADISQVLNDRTIEVAVEIGRAHV